MPLVNPTQIVFGSVANTSAQGNDARIVSASTVGKTLFVDAQNGNDAAAQRGTTNAYASGLAAINAAMAGDTIIFRAGTHLFSPTQAPIIATPGLTIIGEGQCLWRQTAVSYVFLQVQAPDFCIRGVKFDGQHSANTVVAGDLNAGVINIAEGADRAKVERCNFSNSKLQSVKVAGNVVGAIIDNNVFSNVAYGTYFVGYQAQDGTVHAPKFSRVTNNEFRDGLLPQSQAIAFHFDGNANGEMARNAVTGNRISNFAYMGAEFFGGGTGFANADLLFAFNIIDACQYSVSFNQCQNVLCAGNVITRPSAYAALEMAGSTGTVRGNSINCLAADGTKGVSGVIVDGPACVGVTVEGNTVVGANLSLLAYNGASNTIFRNNTVFAPSAAKGCVLCHESTGEIIEGNALHAAGAEYCIGFENDGATSAHVRICRNLIQGTYTGNNLISVYSNVAGTAYNDLAIEDNDATQATFPAYSVQLVNTIAPGLVIKDNRPLTNNVNQLAGFYAVGAVTRTNLLAYDRISSSSKVVTAAYALLPSDPDIEANATAGAFPITLFAASGNSGLVKNITNAGGANNVTLALTGSDTFINGASSLTLTPGANATLKVNNEGTKFIIL